MSGLLEAIRLAGVRPGADLRDAVHEAIHAHRWHVPVGTWGDRERIHRAGLVFCNRAPARLFHEEVIARAAEWVACDEAGLEYDPDAWAAIACMEAYGAGVRAEVGSWREAIKAARMDAGARALEVLRHSLA